MRRCSGMALRWRPGRERSGSEHDREGVRRLGRSDRADVRRQQADAVAHHCFRAPRFGLGDAPPARGGTADQGADDRCDGVHAGRRRARSGGAGDAADGAVVVGNSRGRIRLFHLASGREPGDRAVQGRFGSGRQHRQTQPEAADQFRPHPARRVRAADQAAHDRRRADPCPDLAQRGAGPDGIAAAGRGVAGCSEADPAGRGDCAHRRAEAPDPRAPRSGAYGFARRHAGGDHPHVAAEQPADAGRGDHVGEPDGSYRIRRLHRECGRSGPGGGGCL